jgi:hypothetical protein
MEEIMEAYLWQVDVFNKVKTALHPTVEQDEADDDNVHDEGEGKSERITTKNIWSRQGSATGEESIALKRAQALEKKRKASDKALKEEAKNAKKRKVKKVRKTQSTYIFSPYRDDVRVK